jgi:hypothetical protein
MNPTETYSPDTGVVIPDSGIIDKQWILDSLARVDIFSAELVSYGKGSIFFLARSNMSPESYAQVVTEIGLTVETADKYINYLQLRPVLEAIKKKYYIAISLAASELLPDSIDEALALCDICIAKYGRLTADNLRKALEDTGAPIKKLSDSALSIEKLKRQAMLDWLLEAHELSEEDVRDASSINPIGKQDYLAAMLQAHSLLGDFTTFYDIIAKPLKDSNNMKALRFLSDFKDASGSVEEFLASEKAHNKLVALKLEFESEVYPLLVFNKEK